MHGGSYEIPKLVAENGFLIETIPSKRHLLLNRLNIFSCENLHNALYPSSEGEESGKQLYYFMSIFAAIMGKTKSASTGIQSIEERRPCQLMLSISYRRKMP